MTADSTWTGPTRPKRL